MALFCCQHWCQHGYQALSCAARGAWHVLPELLSVIVEKLSHQNSDEPANNNCSPGRS